MIYGATNRHSWSYDNVHSPVPVWQLWQSFGIEDAQMKGYWEADCPVKTDHQDVKATTYIRPGKTLIAIGNFDTEKRSIHLSFDWKQLGLNPSDVVLRAPEICNFQHEQTFHLSDAITVEGKKGWLIELKNNR
jgi:hypothetical protein